jgi:hypothetical protein
MLDRNAIGGEHAGEGRASELRALVGIEDVRLAVTSHDRSLPAGRFYRYSNFLAELTRLQDSFFNPARRPSPHVR